MRHELLKYVLAQSAPNVGGQYPRGYCYLPAAQTAGAQECQAEGLLTAYPQNAQPDGSFPVMLTDAGHAAASAPPPAQSQGDNAQRFDPAAIRIEKGIAMPDVQRRGGFQPSEGGSIVDRYGFDKMEVGDSFHIPQTNDPDKPAHRAFSSAVSQANRKLHPKAFAVRPVGRDDPAGEGARVWRVQDLTGPRPTRARKADAAPAPAAQPQGQPSPGFGAPQAGSPPAGFGGPPQGFGAAPGFAPPAPGFGQPAPEAPQGFPAAGPQGFAPGGPSFGG